MSLRSYRDQIDAEDSEAAKSPELRRIEADAWNLPKEKIRDAVECSLHVARVGVFCARSAGAFYVCKARRIRAAHKLAGL